MVTLCTRCSRLLPGLATCRDCGAAPFECDEGAALRRLEAASGDEATHSRVDARLDVALLKLRLSDGWRGNRARTGETGVPGVPWAADVLQDLEHWRVGWPGHGRLAMVTAVAALVAGDLAAAARYGDLAVRFDPERYRPPQSTVESIAFWVYRARRAQLESAPLAATDAYELGRCRAMFGAYAEALEAYVLALRARPDDAEVLTAIGVAYRVLGRTFEAVRMHERAISIAPELALAHSNLTAALADAGRLGEAGEACRRALALDRRRGDAPLNLGVGLLKAGRAQEALEALGSVLQHDPALMPAAAVHQGAAHCLLGDAEAALEIVARAEDHELAHRVPHLAMPRAAALAALARTDAAAQIYEEDVWAMAL